MKGVHRRTIVASAMFATLVASAITASPAAADSRCKDWTYYDDYGQICIAQNSQGMNSTGNICRPVAATGGSAFTNARGSRPPGSCTVITESAAQSFVGHRFISTPIITPSPGHYFFGEVVLEGIPMGQSPTVGVPV